jgi:hypothetical protein
MLWAMVVSLRSSSRAVSGDREPCREPGVGCVMLRTRGPAFPRRARADGRPAPAAIAALRG